MASTVAFSNAITDIAVNWQKNVIQQRFFWSFYAILA